MTNGSGNIDAELERYINKALVHAAMFASQDTQTGIPTTVDPVQLAAEGTVPWTPSVQWFLTELARESVIRRDSEWVERTTVSPQSIRTSGEQSPAYNRLVEAFREAMRGGEEIRNERENRAPLIATVQGIKDHWCGVFPLCQ
jgi:hypothetical protein